MKCGYYREKGYCSKGNNSIDTSQMGDCVYKDGEIIRKANIHCSEGKKQFIAVRDAQHAREIIGQVGDKYQKLVSKKLMEIPLYSSHREDDKLAEEIISIMESEYVLKTANILWEEKFEVIPQWLKERVCTQC